MFGWKNISRGEIIGKAENNMLGALFLVLGWDMKIGGGAAVLG
jgi:hypothetical protein